MIYYSENCLVPAERPILASLKDIMSSSVRNNTKRDLTGALAFDSQWFYQALEGEREAVWTAFTAIMDDPRHSNIVLVECKPIATRMFAGWAMRLASNLTQARDLLHPFAVDGIIRPNLMSGADITRILRVSTGLDAADDVRRAS